MIKRVHYKGVREKTTKMTDDRLILEKYIEIYRIHPYLTKTMVSRMQLN